MEKQITIGTKTIYGEVHAIHANQGECTYFCVDRFDALNIIPEEMILECLSVSLPAMRTKSTVQ